MDILFLVKLLLLPLATWRLYRLFATDTGAHQIFRRLRVKLGVRYNKDYSEWTSSDGSLAEGITCIWCASIWWGILLSLLLLFAPDWAYLVLVLPLNASAGTIVFENIIYAPRTRKRSKPYGDCDIWGCY